jgi:hypothetical protein
VALVFHDTADTLTTTGWTVSTSSLTNTTKEVVTLYRIADATDVAASNYTFDVTTGGAIPVGGVIFRVVGAGNVAPQFDTHSLSGANVTSFTNAASITQASNLQDGSLVIMYVLADDNLNVNTSGYTITGPTVDAWTEVFDDNNAGATQTSSVAYTFTNNLSTITGYGASFVGNDCGEYTAGIIVVASSALIEVNHAIVVANASTQVHTIESATQGNHALVTANANVNASTVSTQQRTPWQNEAKPTTNWQNETA